MFSHGLPRHVRTSLWYISQSEHRYRWTEKTRTSGRSELDILWPNSLLSLVWLDSTINLVTTSRARACKGLFTENTRPFLIRLDLVMFATRLLPKLCNNRSQFRPLTDLALPGGADDIA
jgi:hypothetical protein